MNKDNNIFFFTKDISLEDNKNDKVIDINNEIENILKSSIEINSNFFDETIFNNQSYYTEECTIKELLKICKYYGIDKNIKSTKCKKQDIISAIIFFENLPENFEIVFQRNKMWTYINELKMDTKMKQYILWN